MLFSLVESLKDVETTFEISLNTLPGTDVSGTYFKVISDPSRYIEKSSLNVIFRKF